MTHDDDDEIKSESAVKSSKLSKRAGLKPRIRKVVVQTKGKEIN